MTKPSFTKKTLNYPCMESKNKIKDYKIIGSIYKYTSTITVLSYHSLLFEKLLICKFPERSSLISKLVLPSKYE